MRKLKKLLSGVLSLAVLFTFIPVINAAEAPSSMTVKREAVMESYIGNENGFTSYITTDGTIVYCMDLEKAGATTGTKYTYSIDGDAELIYII